MLNLYGATYLGFYITCIIITITQVKQDRNNSQSHFHIIGAAIHEIVATVSQRKSSGLPPQAQLSASELPAHCTIRVLFCVKRPPMLACMFHILREEKAM